MAPARVVVVGGGIAGLAAAHELAGRPGVSVTLCEASERLGGKIRTEAFAGVDLDLGPDAFLARRPEAVTLCRELGLEDELVAPATTSASVWVGGRLRRLPAGLVLGVPTRWGPLARSGVLSPLGLGRAAVELLLPGRPLAGDAALGAVVRRRLGAEAHRRLVAPLVGGINAGNTDRLSIEVCAPQLAAAARGHASLVRGARAVAAGAGAGAGAGPVFLTVPGGLERLVEALSRRLGAAGAEVRTTEPVRALEPGPDGAYLVVSDRRAVVADAVVVALPAPAAGRLLAPHAPGAGATLAGVDHASVTLVALAYSGSAVPRPLDGSGFVVAAGEGRLMTACSWSSSKWAHLDRPGQVVLRVSAGRAGDERAPALGDDALVARLRLELGDALGISEPPRQVLVARWPDAFPQYAPGHLDRMAAVHAELDGRLPGVALAGAVLAGVGLPACIGSGRAAARRALETAASAGAAPSGGAPRAAGSPRSRPPDRSGGRNSA
jgi:oxygen-dependent protoporphyrinogen oxidase